ncbi:2'-5' RNA ligase family protein [Afipia sp. TerB]
MSQQLDLFGIPPPCHDRLFWGLVPADRDGQRIFQLANGWRDELGLTGRPLMPAQLHVSLFALGDYAGIPHRLIDAARGAGDAVRLRPFDVAFDRVMSFYRRDRRRAFVLRPSARITALSEFHRALGDCMKDVGLSRWVTPRFTPHITLLYDRRMIAEQPVEAVCWHVDRFALIHSLVGRSRHIHLARWKLAE